MADPILESDCEIVEYKIAVIFLFKFNDKYCIVTITYKYLDFQSIENVCLEKYVLLSPTFY